MGRRVIRQLALVVAAGDHRAGDHHNRAHGDVAVGEGGIGFVERHAHGRFVVHGGLAQAMTWTGTPKPVVTEGESDCGPDASGRSPAKRMTLPSSRRMHPLG